MKWAWSSIKFLVFVLVVAAAGLGIAGRRAGAGHLHSEIEIDRPAAEVWEWVSESDKLKQWVSWLVDVRTGDLSRRGVGIQRVLVMRDENNGGQLMEIVDTCTDYAPPSLLKMSLTSQGAFEGDQAYRITGLGGGRSRLAIDSNFRFTTWFARLMEPLITPAAQKKMRRDITRLKQLAEEER